MSIRCFYSLNPGEAFVAAQIISSRLGVSVFFPHKDTGVDLAAFSDLSKSSRCCVTVQVKESRYHGNSHSWHQVRQSKIQECRGMVDAFVFVTYREVPDGKRVRWKNEFVVVPIGDLEELVRAKHGGKQKIFVFYFAFEGDKVWEVRESQGHRPNPKAGAVDYTRFHNAWHLLWTN
jgi:hypothetical protein